MEDCIFCRIVKGKTSTNFEYETENFIVFKDIYPSAPIHFLIVPKKHLIDLSECDDNLWLEVRRIALKLQEKLNLDGFRLATNVGSAAIIKHMHAHFLGGITKTRKV